MARSLRAILREPPPADAKRLGNLAWVLDDSGRQPCIAIWYGRAERPKRYRFQSAEHREKWLASQVA